MTDTLGPPRGNWRKAIPLLILAGLCAYCNSFTKSFVLDDARWITDDYNPADAAKYLSLDNDLTRTRPVVSLSLVANAWVQNSLGGEKEKGHHEMGYHAFNLVIQLLAGLALFGVVRRTLLLESWPEHVRAAAPWLAFAVALLWMNHPMQTQCVTYIIQRCESMMGMFFLAALYCAIRS